MSDAGPDKPGHDDGHESERERRTANLFLLIAAAVFIGAGIWLIDALLAARKADECLSAGRRNCVPAERLQR